MSNIDPLPGLKDSELEAEIRRLKVKISELEKKITLADEMYKQVERLMRAVTGDGEFLLYCTELSFSGSIEADLWGAMTAYKPDINNE